MRHFIRNILCFGALILPFILPFILHAEQATSQRKGICFNMIVKNESTIIERCLTSVLPIIDYWVIVDTGSTDGTQQKIRDFMKAKGVPGELYERPWVNFAHNRNEALALAKDKGNYLFSIDADEYVEYSPGFALPQLDKDYYYVTSRCCSGAQYSKILLINNFLDWKWEGVLHEVIVPPPSRSFATIENMINVDTKDGARAKDPLTLEKDIAILQAALKDEPNNSRYVFYLAQTYAATKNYHLALQNYEKRVAMGGGEGGNEEIFWSLLRIAQLQELFKMASEIVVQSYKRAYQYRPTRPEPLYYLAHYYRQKGEYASGYEVAKIGLLLPPVSQDLLLIERSATDYGLLLEFSICAYWIGRYEECQVISVVLLQKPELPVDVRACVEKNLGFANSKLLDCIGAKKQNESETACASEAITDSYKRTFQSCTSRAEPLYHLAHHYRCKGEYALGCAVAKIGLSIPRPRDLSVEEWVYDYGMLFEFSLCAYWKERYQEAQAACQLLLKKSNLPSDIRESVQKNLDLATAKL